MRNEYVCEKCGKRYLTEEEALQCEVKHAEKEQRERELAETKEARRKEVEEKINEANECVAKYLKDYPISREPEHVKFTNFTLFPRINTDDILKYFFY